MLRWLFSGLLLALIAQSPALAGDWVVDREASSVGFETEVFGGPVSGDISDFDAGISLDPDNLTDARIDARVGVASVDSGSAELNGALASESGLAPNSHPDAQFMSDTITEANDCAASGAARCLVATGEFTIKGETRPAILPFTLTILDGRAIADGHLDIVRSDFGIGGPSWGDSAHDIRVLIHIEATPAD